MLSQAKWGAEGDIWTHAGDTKYHNEVFLVIRGKQINEDNMGGECGTHGGEKYENRISVGKKPKGGKNTCKTEI